jgi:hypothetical protein
VSTAAHLDAPTRPHLGSHIELRIGDDARPLHDAVFLHIQSCPHSHQHQQQQQQHHHQHHQHHHRIIISIESPNHRIINIINIESSSSSKHRIIVPVIYGHDYGEHASLG